MGKFAVDNKGVLEQVMGDESRKIPKAHLDSVCCIHNRAATCRYIALGPKGFICVKNTPLKQRLDAMVSEKEMAATGDNCEGLGELLEDKIGEEENPSQSNSD